ncbi:MAG: hypothetical protein K2K09_03075, partial [Lachnospiraceae bacterium]|nr:hypothetical protein [Lachnospiraceae bacterium]
MLRAIIFELQKIMKSKFMWGLLLFFLAADGYIFTQTYFGINKLSEGEKKIYSEVTGTITQDKLDFVIENYKKYSKIIDSGEYSEQGGQEGTYTGYIMGDYGVFREIYEELQAVYDYKGYIAQICNKARENVKRQDGIGNSYGVRKYSLIYRSYAGREINSFYVGEVAENFFSYDFSTVFMFLLLAVGIGNCLLLDKENNMYEIIESAPFGHKKRAAAKIFAIALFCLGVVAIFTAFDLSVMQFEYRAVDNWDIPLYALPGYADTPLNCTVVQFFCLWMSYRYIAMLLFAFIVYTMYMIFLDGIKTIAYSIMVFCGFVFISMKTKAYFNPVAMLNAQEMLKECRICNIFGKPFFYHETVLGMVASAVIILGLIMIVLA